MIPILGTGQAWRIPQSGVLEYVVSGSSRTDRVR